MQTGNYICDIDSEAEITAPGAGIGGSGFLGGHGAPSADPGVDVAEYVDLDTGDVYNWYSSAWHAATGGSSSVRVLTYTAADPNVDGVVPAAPNSPAIAYKVDGTGPIYTWRTDTHVWI